VSQRADQPWVDRHNARVARQREDREAWHPLPASGIRITPQDLHSFEAAQEAQRLAPDAVDLEEKLAQDIIGECNRRGWLWFRSRTDLASTRREGEWDFEILADGGRTFRIECKRRGEKERPEQLGLRLWAERLGHRVAVVWSFRQFLEVIDA